MKNPFFQEMTEKNVHKMMFWLRNSGDRHMGRKRGAEQMIQARDDGIDL